MDCENWLYSGPLNNAGVNLHIIYNQPSVSLDSTNHGPHTTVVYTVEKYLHMNWPMQFKPM